MNGENTRPVQDEKGTSTILERPERSLAGLSATASTSDASSFADADRQGLSGELSRIENTLTVAARLLSKHSNAIVALWLCVVAASMVGFSRQKPLWADEVIFRWIATLPSVRDIWHALALGLNTDPPLDHLLTHALTAIFGAGTLVVRLTSIGGICVMLLCLFLTLRKFVGPLYALLGLALPFCTIIVDYGYEARPYALMYGCFALAIYCWVKAGEDGSHRIAWNVALGLSLAGALACHFYAVFALPAFYLAEAVRSQRQRRVSWPTLGAILGASATVLLYWPIIVGARQYSSAYFEKPSLTSIPSMLEQSLGQFVIPLFAFLAFVAIFATLGVRFTREDKTEERIGFRELTALGLGFLLVPVLAWAAGIVVLKAFTARYVFHGLLGVFLLLPLFAGRVFRQDRALGLALLMACGLPALVFAVQGTKRVFKAPNHGQDLARIEQALPKLSGDIVVSDPHLLLEMIGYSPALKAKCIYLWDRKNESTYTGQDGFSHFAGAGEQMGLFRSEPWSQYSNKDKAFLFLTTPNSQSDGLGWLRAHLEAYHRYGDVVAKAGKYLIVEAKPGQEATLSSAPPSPDVSLDRGTSGLLPVAQQEKTTVH